MSTVCTTAVFGVLSVSFSSSTVADKPQTSVGTKGRRGRKNELQEYIKSDKVQLLRVYVNS